jgi:hypothetical protein
VSNKENINRIRTLCDSLRNRDVQLKLNEKTLWIVFDKIVAAQKGVDNIVACKDSMCKDSISESLEGFASELKLAINIVSEKGCKRVDEDAN